MVTLQTGHQGPEKEISRPYRHAVMHVLEAAYWFLCVGVLIIAGADLWVYGATVILAVPLFVACSVMMRARLGILGRR